MPRANPGATALDLEWVGQEITRGLFWLLSGSLRDVLGLAGTCLVDVADRWQDGRLDRTNGGELFRGLHIIYLYEV